MKNDEHVVEKVSSPEHSKIYLTNNNMIVFIEHFLHMKHNPIDNEN